MKKGYTDKQVNESHFILYYKKILNGITGGFSAQKNFFCRLLKCKINKIRSRYVLSYTDCIFFHVI